MKELIIEKWNDILNLLEANYGVSRIIIDTWIANLEIFEVKDDVVYFCVDEKRGKHGIEYLIKKGYDQFLLSSIREILNNTSIDIKIAEKQTLQKKTLSDYATTGYQSDTNTTGGLYVDAVKRSNLNPKYTFENFIVGDSNRHAFSVCLAVADMPALDNYNPLFIYGGSGLGKTHLMHSIAHYILQHNLEANVLYVTSETFTNEIIEAIRKNKTEEFRAKYRNVDVLLIDDIQEIIDRESTQQEFFNTFNFLYENKKQIIISSDKPPKDLKSLEERYRTRFEWGVPIDIHAPDYETRMAILKTKAEKDGLKNVPEEVFRYIAEKIVSNVRELEGALNKISIYSNLMNIPVTVSMAEEILKDLITKDSDIVITPEFILNTVSVHMDVSIDDIKSKKRNADIANARQIVMYLCRNLTDKSLKSIGDVVGGKDHATVFSGIKRIEEKIKDDPVFKKNLETLEEKINPKSDKS